MEAQAWTAIGLLAATLVGALFYLGNRMDSLGARLDSRIDDLAGRLDSRIDGLAGRIDGLDTRIDGLSGRIDGLSLRVEDQGRQLGSKLEEHLRWHAG
jgi:hypothetical protein